MKKSYRTWIFISAILCIAIYRVFVYLNYRSLSDDITSITNSVEYNAPITLDGVPIKKQNHAYSCGPATIAMAYEYLIDTVSEQEIIENNGLLDRRKGMLPNVFRGYLAQSLMNYQVKHLYNLKDSELLKTIYLQLKNNIPVPIYFSTTNAFEPTNFDTHYSLVTGIDLSKKTISIANAYGFEEKIAVAHFLDCMKYNNFKRKPLLFKIALWFGYIKYSNIYVLTQK